MQPHDEFLELCAVSTSGELSEQEKSKLDAHLSGCADCRQALHEFEAAVDLGPISGHEIIRRTFRRFFRTLRVTSNEVRASCIS